MLRRHALKNIAASPLLVPGIAVFATGCSPQATKFQGVDLSGVDYARDLPLTDQNGQRRSIKDFAGKVVVVFFGYTQCPDVCPTTMSELVEVKRSLGADGARLQAVFVSVDPERDTPELLKAYMANFDPSFIALRGSPEELTTVARDFKIYYKRVDGSTPGSYTMDHSAGSYVYDTAGRLRLYHRYGSGVQALAADVRTLLAQAS